MMPDKTGDKTLEKELDMLDDTYEEVGEDDGESADKIDERDDDEGTTTANVDGEEDSDDTKTEGKKDDNGKTESEETPSSDADGEGSEDGSQEGSETTEDLDDAARIATLTAEINRLSGLVSVKPAASESKVDESVDKTTTVAKDDSSIDFVGELNMDDVASDPDILNTILNKVMQKGIEIGKGFNKSYFAETVPQVVLDHVNQFSSNKDVIDQFYQDNPDLANVKQVVKACASQIVSENPEMQWNEVLTKSADASRKTLGIKKAVVTKTEAGDPANAAFASQKGGQRKKGKKVSKLQQEIDEL